MWCWSNNRFWNTRLEFKSEWYTSVSSINFLENFLLPNRKSFVTGPVPSRVLFSRDEEIGPWEGDCIMNFLDAPLLIHSNHIHLWLSHVFVLITSTPLGFVFSIFSSIQNYLNLVYKKYCTMKAKKCGSSSFHNKNYSNLGLGQVLLLASEWFNWKQMLCKLWGEQ